MMGQLLVAVRNPKALDETVQSFGSVVMENPSDPSGYQRDGEGFIVVCYRDMDFTAFAIRKQGYGKVLGWRETDQDEWRTPSERNE